MDASAASDVEADVAAVGRLDIVPTMLDVVCRATGMGFAAIARVTEDRWIACAVKDEIAFGLQPGGELVVETTICHEIRASGTPVVIDHAAMDEAFCRHPTPAMYGFESYISVPIVRRDGRFFGTLCAIDPRPVRLSRPEIVGMFRLFAQLIGFHLDAHDQLEASRATPPGRASDGRAARGVRGRAGPRSAQPAGRPRLRHPDAAPGAARRGGDEGSRPDAEQRRAHVGAGRRRAGSGARPPRRRARARALGARGSWARCWSRWWPSCAPPGPIASSRGTSP